MRNVAVIVVRELRALARRPSAYGMRGAFLGLPALAWALALLIWGGEDGVPILMTTSLVAMLLVGFGGALAVSDAISAERRQQTLGLLLLTPLRPGQVLLGKLASSGLQFALCLLAVFPVMALSLLSGGVTGAEVLRQCGNLLAVVFLGMGVGLFGSALCREAKASAGLGFFLMLLIVLAPACAGVAVVSAVGGFSPPPILGVLLGPAFLAITALEEEVRRQTIWLYVWNVGGVLMLGLVFLLGAWIAFAIVWAREKNPQAATRSLVHRKLGKKRPGLLGKRRRKLRFDNGDNPYARLALAYGKGSLFSQLSLWFLAAIFLSFALTPLVRGESYLGTDWGGCALLTVILMEIVVRWLVALEAPRPIQTDRDSGMLELVLVTPLASEQVVSGLRSGLKSSLGSKAKVLVGCHVLQMFFMLDLFSSDPFEVFRDDDWRLFLLFHLGWVLGDYYELRCLQVVGVWWGLRSKSSMKVSVWLFLVFCLAPVVLPLSVFVGNWFSWNNAVAWMIILWHVGRFLWARCFAWQSQRKLRSLRQLAGD